MSLQNEKHPRTQSVTKKTNIVEPSRSLKKFRTVLLFTHTHTQVLSWKAESDKLTMPIHIVILRITLQNLTSLYLIE